MPTRAIRSNCFAVSDVVLSFTLKISCGARPTRETAQDLVARRETKTVRECRRRSSE